MLRYRPSRGAETNFYGLANQGRILPTLTKFTVLASVDVIEPLRFSLRIKAAVVAII
jgi:hypothetical protein